MLHGSLGCNIAVDLLGFNQLHLWIKTRVIVNIIIGDYLRTLHSHHNSPRIKLYDLQAMISRCIFSPRHVCHMPMLTIYQLTQLADSY